MTRPTNPNGRSRNVDENLNKSDLSTSNNKTTSTSKNQTAPPTLRSIAENNGVKLYPFIQQGEYKYKDLLTSHENSSSSNSELTSRLSSAQKKDDVIANEVHPTQSFEQMPEDVIRKILFEQFIDLNDIPATAKYLMHFASISKFNREFIRQLLTEEGMHEVSFEITKSVIPNLLATLANDKKAKFTDADIDELVLNWPYLTFDSSLKENTIFTNRGLEELKKIVSHSDLKGIRIINNLPAKISESNENFLACNFNGLELLYSLLSRKSSNSLKVDFIFKNWMPPEQSIFQVNEKSLDLIKKIQSRYDNCSSVTFGEIDLSREFHMSLIRFSRDIGSISSPNREYQFQFVKMMCNIGLMHSMHTISLKDLYLLGDELILILDEILQCGKSSLQHLDLSGNRLGKATAERLGALLQSENTCLKTLKLNDTNMFEDEFDILDEILKTNHSLQLVEIKDVIYLRGDHPLRNDKRVIITCLND